MNRNSQRGIALVITLIMLSVVTVMVVIFLGVSTRERGSVTVSADFTDAKLAADMALNRAQAEVVSRIAASSNLLAYDLVVSTNFITPGGFRPGVSSFTNVSYSDANNAPLRNIDQIRQNLTNLFYDPRPPVYVGSDFRYYLDLNRNGRFDTNGWAIAPERNNAFTTNNFVGDPEWIGILEHPDRPHSSSNRFVGRFAYLVVPAGKTLDINYIHNAVKAVRNGSGVGTEGFRRNLGVGSWEINLAALLRDLNPNIWGPSTYNYQTNVSANDGLAFADALAILSYREPSRPRTVVDLFGAAATRLTANPADIYSDGPLMTGTGLPLGDDNPNRYWSGADSTNGRSFVSVTELFDTNKVPAAFVRRLGQAITPNFVSPTPAYDRYTFSRLAGQLGTDSLPANRGKLNLNFDNVDRATGQIDPALALDMRPWEPVRFFTNAARLILQSQFGNLFTPNSTGFEIPIWQNGTNFYTAEVHRALQLAANIWDASTNRSYQNLAYPYYPSVFRPVFGGQNGNVSIVGYIEETGTNFFNQPWRDLNLVADRTRLADPANRTNNVFGVPLLIGARKGFPNFNEFNHESIVHVTRRLQAEKTTKDDRPPNIRFYQSYEFGISNYFGLEAWNSYASNYPRGLHLVVTNRAIYSLRDNSPVPLRVTNTASWVGATVPADSWLGGQFRVPITNVFTFLSNSTYNAATRRFSTLINPIPFDRIPGFPNPIADWKLTVTNRIQFMLVDTAAGRVIDFVNLDNMVSSIDIGKELAGRTETVGGAPRDLSGVFWQTNRVASGIVPGNPTAGITNQVNASISPDLYNSGQWNNYSGALGGKDVESAIDGFRAFLGLTPIFNITNTSDPPLVMQVPFTPTRIMRLRMSWQANDPLVHYHLQDLFDPAYTDTNNVVPLTLTELAIPEPSNLGGRNPRYRPWGKLAGESVLNEDLARQDPMVRSSDDWNFPTNQYPGVGWLGRVHRGTPWQTMYLKSAVEPLRQWTVWSGSPFTHPTNDWWILSQFTTAPNDNAAHGLLSVNQTNLAAWSAVLGSVAILSNNLPDSAVSQDRTNGYAPLFVEPGSLQLQTIVSNINATRLAQTNLPPYEKFRSLGHLLASPALTLNSPYLNLTTARQAKYGIGDEAYERIPQQLLSLLKDDEPFLVVYAYGQSLKPADRSLVTAPGPYQGLCTNYQITGEYATKTAIRYQETRQANGKPSIYRGIVESYTVLPPE